MQSRWKNVIASFLTSVLCLCLFSGCAQEEIEYTHETICVSWSYSYNGVAELAMKADLIAENYIEERSTPALSSCPSTRYTAQITRAIFGCEDNEHITISMTGGIVDTTVYEVSGDPLMEVGETYIIFARENGKGNDSYTILSGGQGRFLVEGNTVTSLAGLDFLECADFYADDPETRASYLEYTTDPTKYPVGIDKDSFYETVYSLLASRESESD